MRKRITTVVVGTVGAFALLIAPASAHHTVDLTFSANPVVAGTVVTITATTTASPEKGKQKLKINQCRSYALDGVTVSTTPAPKSVCEAMPAGGEWVQIAQAPNSSYTTWTHSFATTGLGGQTIGFQAHQPPNSSDHSMTQSLDLVVNAVVTAAEHPGCQGVENALAKVSDNGNAKTALQKVFQKLGCVE